MQVRKVAVVATGALATAAVMGSTPAFAADSAGISEVGSATIGLLDYEGKHRTSDAAMRQIAERWLAATPEQTGSLPSEPQILAAGNGSAVSVAPVQQCGSNGSLAAGVTVPVDSPATVAGSCNNGNLDVAGGDGDALISVLNGSAISALALQTCGSNGSAVGGLTAPIGSPAAVVGDCNNGNLSVTGTPEQEDPGTGDPGYLPRIDPPVHPYQLAEQVVAAPESTQILTAGQGTAASLAPLQQCGSNGSLVGGVTAPIDSPAMVAGTCDNGNIDIHGAGGTDALFSILDSSAASVAAWQTCGSNSGGILGVAAPIASPATAGGCNNGNLSLR